MAGKALDGLFRYVGKRAWMITWPYREERYLYFGPEATAKSYAKKLTRKWPYGAKVRELEARK